MENSLTSLLSAEPTHTPDAPEPTVQDKSKLSRLVDYYTSAEEASQTAREKAERDRDYYDGKQLTEDEYQALKKRGQPPIAFNIIRSRVDFHQGLEKKQRRDPKAYPRNNPQDVEAADAFTDGMRYVVEDSDYASARSRGWKNVCAEGFGGVELSAVQKRDGTFDFKITHIPWDRIGYDPHSSAPDFSDAKYFYQVSWMDLDDALARYRDNPDAEGLLNTCLDSDNATSQTYDDKPRWTIWGDKRRKRVRVVMMWYRKPEGWCYSEFTKSGELLSSEQPYVDPDGESYCPWVLESAYVDRDNNRYGVIRDLIDPQDEINKRRSKALHLITTRGVIADEGAVENVADAKRELAKPDFFVTKTPGAAFELIQGSGMAADQMALLQNAQAYVMQAGPNAALLGKGTEDQSGRAIEAQQAGGLIEHGDLLDSLRRMDRRVFRIIAYLIKQFWTAEKWIRVTDDPETPRWVGLNVPKPIIEMRQDPITGQWMQVQTGMAIENNVAEIDVDIIVTDAPEVVSMEGENFKAMVEILKSGLPPSAMKLAIEMHPGLSSKRKKQLTEMVDQMVEEQRQAQQAAAEAANRQQEPTPEQRLAMSVQLAEKRAGIENKNADTRSKDASAAKALAQAEQARSQIQPPVVVPVPVPAPLSDQALGAPVH